MRHALILVAVGIGACRQAPMASLAQCEHLRNRYIDLQLSGLSSAPRMTSEARAMLRGRLAVDDLSGPDAPKLDGRCPSVVTELGFRCAVAAETLGDWKNCLR
jgi:hypothetical protein